MHDRAVRRRRAVLVALVAASLILLTAYFGESSNGGGLHSAQRGAMGVLAPIQEGANRVLKPVRDFFGWFGDTLHAKGQRDQYKRERDQLQMQLAQAQYQLNVATQEGGLKKVDLSAGLDKYGPVNASVYVRSPNAFYQTVVIDKGSGDGIEVGDPVVGSGGLVGQIKTVIDGGSSVVTLITDQDFTVAAYSGIRQVPGTVQPAIGAPGDMEFAPISTINQVHVGDLVSTAGTISSNRSLQSPYPGGIPIGKIKSIDPGEADLDTHIHLSPAADIRHVSVVQVLTDPHPAGATP
jgi:rod shape-determining protein MreC